MEVVEDLLVRLGSSTCGNLGSEGSVPVAWHADGLDFGVLGPFLDAPGDELWFGFTPDSCCDFGYYDGLVIRICCGRSPPGGEGRIHESSIESKEVE